MIETLLITTLIIAICMAFLLVKVLFKRNGEFSSQHIHDSQAMKDRGIHCVMDQIASFAPRVLLQSRSSKEFKI